MGITLVTGASSGIGRSLARRLAAHGDLVVLVARRAELLDTLVMEIRRHGGQALAAPGDVTDRRAVADIVMQVEAEHGPITRLVANAGGGSRCDGSQFDAEHFQTTVALNLVGVANAVAAVLPGMVARRGGHLVAMGSLAGVRGLPGAAAYSAAKGGVANLMDSLRIDLRDHDIDVTLLLPGFVRTQPPKAGRRRFRPFRMELEQATARMENAIIARKRRLAFPWPLVVAIGMTRLLPFGVDGWLLGRFRARKAPAT
ncbi:SDR family NAD(P)-dependent oxidoreductase [Salinisphaera sp. T31B1]|uniref:SDR family NAD(P)-dependent oxidoreductase n=1 Tax=Salinisphaera sp. T31B1 TaxID=727963 RepID=UPI00333E3404